MKTIYYQFAIMLFGLIAMVPIAVQSISSVGQMS